MLHVQEVWCKSTLWGVGVMWLSLSLLLSTILRVLNSWQCYCWLSSQEPGVGEDIGEVCIESSDLARGEDSVGMVDICSR